MKNLSSFSKISKFLQNISNNRRVVFALIIIFLIPFYGILYKLYIPHLNSFGCFDECMNYLGGYFLLHDRQLYSQIFFNHQPLMAYISWFVLKVFHPSNLFEILLRYREFLLIFSLIANFFIIKRFRWSGLGFVIIFELSKYYLFGDKFLAESFVVYPLVYMTGLIYYKLVDKKIFSVEYVLAGVLSWFVLFSREPFIPIALLLLILILGFAKQLFQKIGYGAFFILTGSIFFLLPLKEYIYQVFTINSQGVGAADAQSTGLFGWGILHVVFYPLDVFLGGQWNEFRVLLVGLSIVFCLISVYFLVKKQYKIVFISLTLLGLANLRPIVPGQLFYSSFHFIPYFGMFVLLTLLYLEKLKGFNKKSFFLGIIFLTFIVGSFVLLSKNFIFLRINQQTEFVINFGESYEVGSVIHALSRSSQTFFIDNSDNVDIAYLVSGRDSPYQYADYGYVGPNYPKFQIAYKTMWNKNPPDFYYGSTIPKNMARDYQVLEKEGKPSHIFVKKSILKHIAPDAWEHVSHFGYLQPQEM